MNYKIVFALVAVFISLVSVTIFGLNRITIAAENKLLSHSGESDLSAVKTPTPENKKVVLSSKDAAKTSVRAKTAGEKTSSETGKKATVTEAKSEVYNGEKIVRTEAEWRKLLTAKQFYILREKGTEEAYTGAYTDNKQKGIYHCAACDLALFTSATKYNSETGWPSFYAPLAKANILEEIDKSLPEETRTEVLCARCDSHLGHVFDDGPKPTGLRYCINSAALVFKKEKVAVGGKK